MWRNRQTRRIQVPVVVNTLWVQVPSSAPNKKDAYGVFFIWCMILMRVETLMVSPSNSSFLPISL